MTHSLWQILGYSDCGIQGRLAQRRILNLAKREEPYSASCHLDFHVDQIKTIAGAKGRHRVMTVNFFGKFNEYQNEQTPRRKGTPKNVRLTNLD